MPTDKKISIILAAYNCEKYITYALESIKNQTFAHFECIIVDDASTDKTTSILQNIEKNDPRFKIIINKHNQERSYSRNAAVQRAQGELIAIMDADDWSHPDRLRRQYDFMQQHPHLTLCGTFIQTMETHVLWSAPTEDQALKCALLFADYLYHPTIMCRKEALVRAGGYAESMPPVEDYDLWTRLAINPENQFAVIPEPLVRYRLNLNAPRPEYKERQRRLTDDVRRRYLHACGFSFDATEWTAHQLLCRSRQASSFDELATCPIWMEALLRQNRMLDRFPESELRRILAQQWLAACRWNAPVVDGTPWLYARHPVQATGPQRIFRSGRLAASALKHTIRRWFTGNRTFQDKQ